MPRTTESSAAAPALLPGCDVRWLGTVPYADGLALQQDLAGRRAAGTLPDQLLLLEHPHVLTLGRAAKPEHVLAGRERLGELGVELFETGRGGDVTYHGPGQLVAYPILDLAPDRCDLHRYVRDLERVMLAVLADYGVTGHTVAGRTGVWVRREGRPEAKIGAIGVRISRWITTHGIALNVTSDLQYFGLIVPCGIAGSAVTSLEELVGPAGMAGTRAAPADGAPAAPGPAAARAALTVQSVAARFATHFGVIFERQMRTAEGRPVPIRPAEARFA